MKRFFEFFCAAALLLSGTFAWAAGTEVIIDTVRYDTSYDYPSHLYIIRPADAKGKLPCVMFVTGSAWKKQNMRTGVSRVTPLAEMGYVVACVEYRPCSYALFPAQVEDSKTATRYMRAHAAEYQIDTDRIFAMGGSSGGHTVLLHSLTQNSTLMDSGRLPDWSCEVKAVVDFYGPSELVKEFRIENGYQRNPDSNGGLLLGDPVSEKRDIALKASPLYYVHPYAVPTMIIHGDADRVVPIEQSILLEQRFRECGVRCEFITVPGGGHGTLDLWTDDMFRRIDTFLKSIE